MKNQIINFFIPNEEEYSFDIALKSKTFLIFSFILSTLLIILWLILIAKSEYSIKSMLSLSLIIIITSNIVSLFILRAGKYYAAVNTLIIFALTGFSLFLLSGTARFVIISGYQLFIFLILCSLFCKKRMTLITTLFILIIQSTALLSSRTIGEAERITALINFSFELIILTAISYLIMSITDKTVERLKEEADNKEHLQRTRELLISISKISGQLTDSFSIMSSTTESFSNNAQNQAAATEEIAATIEEISAGAENIANSAGMQMTKIEELIFRLSELSEQISSMKNKINEARTMTTSISAEAQTGGHSLKSMEKSIISMSQRSTAMTGIINIINDISDRINLLSLNAAIEAARAGNAGRGFAVVADEISKLADQTFTSVKEISSLIKAGEEESNQGLETVNSVVSSLSKILAGVTGISNMVESMSQFMESQVTTNQTVNKEATDVKQRSDEIQKASEIQKNATSEIIRSISTINELTQANAAGAEEMSTNAISISQIAESLNEKMDNFKQEENMSI
ncbi:MAG: methyl-accepting chemotaxis protein [Spirochaetota bacterium]